MLIITEFLFIVLLTMMLFALYRSERLGRDRSSPHGLIEECWNGVERRQHVRFKQSLPVDYIVEKTNHLNNNGKTVNISGGGAKLLLNEKLPKGAILDLKIHLTDRAIELKGMTVWTEDAGAGDPSEKRLFYSGIQFLTGNQPGYKYLIDYIRSIASQAAEE